MKKALHGVMAAALALGLTAAPAFAAPRLASNSNIVQIQDTAKKPVAKKKTTAKKQPAKKQPAKKTASKPAKKSTTKA